jgi:predicted oxidoreductase
MYYFFFSVHNYFHLVFVSQIYDFIILLTKHSVKKIDPSTNRIGGVMVSVLASRAIDRGFEPRSGQIKDYKIGSCCFSD